MKACFFLFAAASIIWAQSSGVLSGTVTDALTHRPLHAVVDGLGASRDVTAVDGTFTLPDLPAGELKLHITAAGFRPLDTSVKISDGAHLTSWLELHPMARISGRVIDKGTGKPVAGWAKLLILERMVDFYPMEKDGAFEFASLEPGDYKVTIEPGGEAVISYGVPDQTESPDVYGVSGYPETIHLAEGEQKSVDIRLAAQQSRSVTGMIDFPPGHDEGTLSVGYGNLSGGFRESKLLGKHGSGPFRIAGLLPGVYQIFGQTGERSDTFARTGELSDKTWGSALITISDRDIDGLTVKLLPGVNLAGTVRMAEDDAVFPRKPPNPVAILTSVGTAAIDLSAPMRVEGGRFHGDGVPQGDYWPELTGLPDGYAVTDILFGNTTIAGRPISLYGPGELTFVVTSKPGAIVGTVRDSNQNPIRGAKVVLSPQSSGRPGDTLTQTSGASGEFRFRNLAPGKYTVEGVPPIDLQPSQTATIAVTR